jgi:hypothetical protein
MPAIALPTTAPGTVHTAESATKWRHRGVVALAAAMISNRV